MNLSIQAVITFQHSLARETFFLALGWDTNEFVINIKKKRQ